MSKITALYLLLLGLPPLRIAAVAASPSRKGGSFGGTPPTPPGRGAAPSALLHLRRSTALPEGGEEDDFADGAAAGQEHSEAVDADAEATGGWHAVLQGNEEVLIGELGLL